MMLGCRRARRRRCRRRRAAALRAPTARDRRRAPRLPRANDPAPPNQRRPSTHGRRAARSGRAANRSRMNTDPTRRARVLTHTLVAPTYANASRLVFVGLLFFQGHLAFFDFRLVGFACVSVPVAGVARLRPPRTEAAIPLSASVRDGHVGVSAGFARHPHHSNGNSYMALGDRRSESGLLKTFENARET